jgi:hypothetical protein
MFHLRVGNVAQVKGGGLERSPLRRPRQQCGMMTCLPVARLVLPELGIVSPVFFQKLVHTLIGGMV